MPSICSPSIEGQRSDTILIGEECFTRQRGNSLSMWWQSLILVQFCEKNQNAVSEKKQDWAQGMDLVDNAGLRQGTSETFHQIAG
jgi:hypothetical protein